MRSPRSMRASLTILMLATGCGSCGQPALQTTPAANPDTAEEAAWDTFEPVDPADYATKHLFVIAEHAPLCPSVEGALGEGCGSSSEWVDSGYSPTLGEAVLVVDAPPQGGVHRAFRYLTPGIFPGWIRAGALAPRPRLDEAGQRYFAAAIERGPVVELDRDALRAAPLGQPIVLRDVPGEALAYAGGPVFDLTLTLSLDGEMTAELDAALALAERRDHFYGGSHPSIVYDDGSDLSYGNIPEYDDRITMELVRVETEGDVPHFEIRALLDRFGFFTKIAADEEWAG